MQIVSTEISKLFFLCGGGGGGGAQNFTQSTKR